MVKKRKGNAKEKDWTMVYKINGRNYKFTDVYVGEDGIAYGYCAKIKHWAWLYTNAISRYGKDIEMIPAKRIENNVIKK